MLTETKNLIKKMKTPGADWLVLDYHINDEGQEIKSEYFLFDEEKLAWIWGGLNCPNSAALGLGACQCTTHDDTFEEEVCLEFVFHRLQEYNI